MCIAPLQAQVHQRNIQNVAAQHAAAAQVQAQETARVGQQKAAELARKVSAHQFLPYRPIIVLGFTFAASCWCVG